MRRFLLKCVCLSMVLCVLAGCGKKEIPQESPNTSTTESKEEAGLPEAEWSETQWLAGTVEDMVSALHTLINDEKYVNVVMSSTSEVTKILEEWKDLEPVDRENAYCVKLGPEVLMELQGIEDLQGMEELTKEYVYARMGSALANLINARIGGASVLAASASIGYSRTYVPKGTIDNQVLVLPCREQKAIFLSYVNSGDGAVTVTANYVVMPDEEFLEGIKEMIDPEMYVSQISLK